MRKQFAIAMVAIMVMSLVLVMPVVSDEEGMNDTQERAINEAMIRIASHKCIRSTIEGELPSIEELSAALRYSIPEQIKATQVSQGKNITECKYCDITGDSIDDVLVHVTTKDPATNKTSTDINAINGSDGMRLWSKSFENCAVDAYSVRDLNDDNKTDVIITGLCFPPSPERSYYKTIALSGWDGAELWSKQIEMETSGITIVAFYLANLTSANMTDVLIDSVKINLVIGTLTSEVTALNGSNGIELWGRTFIGRVAVVGPVDLTNDGKEEVVITSEQLGSSKTTSDVTAVKGDDGTELWNKHYSGEIDVDFAGDLTGDGANDLTVQIGCCELEALRGYDGKKLWTIEV